MQVSGLPSGATFVITGNNGYTPSGAFSWNITNVTPGIYNFFVTFTDDGCPLSSKQSLAYTVIVYGPPAPGFSLISLPNCNAKARFSLTPANGAVPYRIIVSGGTVADTFKNVTTSVTDSVSPGTYVISTRSTRLLIRYNDYHQPANAGSTDLYVCKASVLQFGKRLCHDFRQRRQAGLYLRC